MKRKTEREKKVKERKEREREWRDKQGRRETDTVIKGASHSIDQK